MIDVITANPWLFGGATAGAAAVGIGGTYLAMKEKKDIEFFNKKEREELRSFLKQVENTPEKITEAEWRHAMNFAQIKTKEGSLAEEFCKLTSIFSHGHALYGAKPAAEVGEVVSKTDFWKARVSEMNDILDKMAKAEDAQGFFKKYL